MNQCLPMFTVFELWSCSKEEMLRRFANPKTPQATNALSRPRDPSQIPPAEPEASLAPSQPPPGRRGREHLLQYLMEPDVHQTRSITNGI